MLDHADLNQWKVIVYTSDLVLEVGASDRVKDMEPFHPYICKLNEFMATKFR